MHRATEGEKGGRASASSAGCRKGVSGLGEVKRTKRGSCIELQSKHPAVLR